MTEDMVTEDPHLADLLELRRLSRGSDSEAYAWPHMMRALQEMILRRQMALAQPDQHGENK